MVITAMLVNTHITIFRLYTVIQNTMKVVNRDKSPINSSLNDLPFFLLLERLL